VTSALAELTGIAAVRLAPARAWRAAGRGPVVGVVGPDVPRELVTAVGGLAVRLHGAPGTDRELGDRYLGRGVDPWARALLAGLLQGGWPGLDALVVGRDSEASSRLFFALRELHRIGYADGVPQVVLCDVLHLPHRSTTRYVERRLHAVAAALGEVAGVRVVDGLAGAVEAHDRVRALLVELSAVRRSSPPRLSGVEALAVHAAVQATDPEQAGALLGDLLAELPTRPPLDGLRVHLTGSSHDEPSVYRALADEGLVVVSEDHDWGDLQGHRPVGVATLTALAERYQRSGPTAQRASADARAALLDADLQQGRPDLVVAYIRERDDAPGWDLPAQRSVCARHGIPMVELDHQEYGRVDLDRLRAALAHPTTGQEVTA